MKTLALAAVLAICSTAVFADADLSLTALPPRTVLTGSVGESLFFTLHNSGPDIAANVFVTITATGGVSTHCEKGCIVMDGRVGAGDHQIFFGLLFPDTPGDVTITASVTSSTPDPNSGNNSASTIFTVSPDPDVVSYVSVPAKADLALPFLMKLYVLNPSYITAHDVDVAVDFRSDVGIKSLPAGCSSPAAGRIVCHSDTLPHRDLISALPTFPVTLVGPPVYGDGKISFAVSAAEREHDFDPTSNTAITPLVRPFIVTSTENDGSGSLRQAILDANAASGPLRISFLIETPSANGWKTILVTSPLPAVTASDIQIDGATQSSAFGDTNADGPDIEISGGGNVDGDGLTIEGCRTEVANLAIGGFRGNGISVVDAHHANCFPFPELHHLFIGTDPTGSEARANGRGIGISIPSGKTFNTIGGGALIHDCVVSGNIHSGIFDLSGFVTIWGNRIGVKAHGDEPLPNGASGIFIGANGYGSAIGPEATTASNPGNVIAFNGEMGVAIATGVKTVSLQRNRIWANGGLGIDIGLDGPTVSTTSEVGVVISAPTPTLAHYDPVLKKTIIEGDVPVPPQGFPAYQIDLYASDAGDPSGFGPGQRPIGTTSILTSPTHFRFEADGDLTGQFITTTASSVEYVGAAKPEGVDQGYLTQTSEFSRWLEVR